MSCKVKEEDSCHGEANERNYGTGMRRESDGGLYERWGYFIIAEKEKGINSEGCSAKRVKCLKTLNILMGNILGEREHHLSATESLLKICPISLEMAPLWKLLACANQQFAGYMNCQRKIYFLILELL